MDRRKQSIGVIGVGLIGGSIAKAASRLRYPVLVYDVDDSLREDVVTSGCGWAHTIEALATRADIIIIAVPGDQVQTIVEALVPFLRPGQILTDVSSSKTSPNAALATAPTGVLVVGGHPLAGKETHGWENADPDLFEGCVWVLCPIDGETVPGELTRLVADLGAGQTIVCSAEEHDRAVASISHGVQAASTSIAAAVNSIVAGERLPWLLAANGWKDTTRIAESDPGVWVPILMDNSDNIVPVLKEIIDRMTRMQEAIESRDEEKILSLLKEGNSARENWETVSQNR